MGGMRLGGIDPSIIRELSGVYKPFPKAFKELVSNAFDADATSAIIEFTDDFLSVSISDDGRGMTPFEFRNDFTRIGGGSRRWSGDRTKKGRLRIGSKGIGFLALARYCSRLRVESEGNRLFSHTLVLPKTPCRVSIDEQIGVPLPPAVLAERLEIEVWCKGKKLREGRDYRINKKRSTLSVSKSATNVTVKTKVVCKGLRFSATLDFDKLLQLVDSADLEQIDDFATIELNESGKPESFQTRITAEELRPFVRKDLRAEKRKGFVRNIGSRSGYDQFLWALSRCTPIAYSTPVVTTKVDPLAGLLAVDKRQTLDRLEVRHNKTATHLTRPVYPHETGSPAIPPDMLVAVGINEGGLKATGFLAGYEEVIFPAEHRGISIRVRGVAIGDPGFLGAEALLTGANKAALSQITGEIIVNSGLDAIDALNPGRESFYEESEHYKILRKKLVGDGERLGGFLAEAINRVLRRSQVRSSVTDVLGRASLRRRALEDISAAITHLFALDDTNRKALKGLLTAKRSHLNGLAAAPLWELGLPSRIGGLATERVNGLPQSHEIDYSAERVRIDVSRPEWRWNLLLFDRDFEVVNKKGKSDQPIAEIDFKGNRILVNWGHPVKLQMDERSFIKSALAFVLAKEAAAKDPNVMMDLALQLMSFTSSTNG